MVTFEGNRLTLQLDQPYAQSYVLNCLSAEVASVVERKTVLSHAEGEDFDNAEREPGYGGSGPFSLGSLAPR